MDWRGIDLNLLVVFRAIAEHRGLTKAGAVLGLSQPAMSASLGRLRDLFGDPLFVRSGVEMLPTPTAQELALPIRETLDRLESGVLRRSQFDPATARRRFTIVTPDIGEVVLLPVLIEWFASHAPGVSLHTIARHPQAAGQALESGEADLAFGFFPDLHRANFFQQKVFDAHTVCLVREGHPVSGRRLSLEAFLAASHAELRPDGREPDIGTAAHAGAMKVVVVVSHFMSLAPIIESSDLMAIVPWHLATIFRRHGAFRTLELPWDAEPVPIHQFWHARLHQDAANMWLRSLIYSLFRDSEAARPPIRSDDLDRGRT